MLYRESQNSAHATDYNGHPGETLRVTLHLNMHFTVQVVIAP